MTDTDLWLDNVWITDSIAVDCGRSRPAARRSQLAGWARYGYCRSHSRWFWGLRPYLICTPAGMPISWALADPELDEREVVAAMLDVEPDGFVRFKRQRLSMSSGNTPDRRVAVFTSFSNTPEPAVGVSLCHPA
ncbi:hypothetical protein ACIBF1_29555 [Spirillospora sp. NPDC050679]